MWIPPECKDPVLRHAPTRKTVGYWGAVRLRDGLFVYTRECERFNAQSCHDFLIKLRQAGAVPGKRTVVIIDNARYHHAKLHQEWRESQSDAFKLDFLPPYSPELNPSERIWKLTRSKAIHNRYFPDIDDVIQAVESVFDNWLTSNDILRRLCAIT